MRYKGTDRVKQVNWLEELAADTWSSTMLPDYLDQGGTLDECLDDLVNEAVSGDILPKWFDAHDERLLREIFARQLLLTTEQVATILGVTASRVRALISAGRLPARKIGWGWAIRASDLELVADRKPGRPKSG